MKQYTITAVKEYEYTKTVFAENLVDAHVQAFYRTEDPEDDWTLITDPDYDEHNPYNITLIEES
tara:strand:+ start:40 stop:231 length:192 start_codon:yes stop_codon:yes gene_type:complete